MAESIFMALKKPATKVNKFLRKSNEDGSENNSQIHREAIEVDSAVSPLQSFGTVNSSTI
jgi:hypothetical protein